MKCLYCLSSINQDFHFGPYFCTFCNINYSMRDNYFINIISYINHSIYDVDYHLSTKSINIVDNKSGIFLFQLEKEVEMPQTLGVFKIYLNKFLKLRAFL